VFSYSYLRHQATTESVSKSFKLACRRFLSKDTTAIGKDLAPPEIRPTLGHYPELAKRAVEAIPGAKLVEFAELGHAPQMQDPKAFHQALLDGLTALPANR
jgi:pimeloyl-ACP methyl ester carboxylesterase